MKYIFIIIWICLFCMPSSGQQRQPNFLFIIVDDLRPQLGIYGHPDVKSPNIDRLASEGLLFNRAYCNAPVCGASRASIFTGLRPLWPARFTSFNTRMDKDSPDAVTLQELFRSYGYTTVSNGKVFHQNTDREGAWSEAPWRPHTLTAKIEAVSSQWVAPSSRNYVNGTSGSGPYFECADVPDTAYFDGQVAAKTVQDIKRLAAATNPFFLAVGFIRPHLPFNAPKKYFDLYGKVEVANNRFTPLGLPKESGGSGEILTYARINQYNSDDFHQAAKRAYYACVSYVDAQVGKVLNALKETGEAAQTVVVLIGDHGWHLGEHNLWGKHNVLENVLRVPLIVKINGIPSKQIDRVVELVDLYPTLCKLANVNLPAGIQGRNMLPLITEKDPQWEDVAFADWKSARQMTTDRYSFTEWVGEKSKGVYMLFDHKEDPGENRNLAGDPASREIADLLKKRLNDFYITLK